MTNEEALNLLQNGLLPEIRGMYYGAYYDALEMAIEALKMEHSEDIKDALHIAQTDRDKWKARSQKLAKIIGIRDCDIDEYEQQHYTDYISRQAAIDEVRSYYDEIYGDPLSIEERIAALPAAQPEIIRCKDCKYAEIADPEDNRDGYTCQFHRGSIWFSGSYCSWAERREE